MNIVTYLRPEQIWGIYDMDLGLNYTEATVKAIEWMENASVGIRALSFFKTL